MRRKRMLCIGIVFALMLQPSLAGSVCSAKIRSKEKVYNFDDQKWVVRKNYGLIAKNVSDVRIGSYYNLWEVFIQHKGQRKVKEVDLFRKKHGKNTNYRMNLVFKDTKKFFPMMDRSFCVDRKKQLLLTGKDVCNLFFEHHTEQECDDSFGKHKNQVVRRNVDGSKIWCDNDMLAYVKNNTLYLTGIAAGTPETYECYQGNTVKTYFEGMGNNIKDVVCGKCSEEGRSSIFVLMKDGSVWGLGSNEKKMLSDSEKKYYSDFIKIISKGVKMIAANSMNVAIIKRNNSLYVWGKTLKSKKRSYSFSPRKIAKNVKEVSISDAPFESDTILVYLKKNHVAYGLGENCDYALTDNYRKSWISKPVVLRNKIKHVYAAPRATMLLNNKDKLYWTGTQDYYSNYNWVNKKKR